MRRTSERESKQSLEKEWYFYRSGAEAGGLVCICRNLCTVKVLCQLKSTDCMLVALFRNLVSINRG